MRILLANLPWKSFGKTGVRAGSRWPHLKGPSERDYLPFPFFLAYSAALLKKYNFEVTLVDAIAEEKSYSAFFKDIRKLKPDIVVCETSTVTLEHDLKLWEKIDKNIPIVLCGPDVNIRKASFFEKHRFIDYVLVDEYEFTLLDLVKCLKEGKQLDDVLGLIYRTPTGIKINPPRPLIDLDELPWPLRQASLMGCYNDTPGDMPIPSAQMLASRGCPYKCKFCLWPQVMYRGNYYRVRDVKDVVDEMEYLVKEVGFKSIYFDDDTFNCGKDRMLRLCDEIKKRNLNVPWAIMARADLMDEEILKSMSDAGLFAVKYGIESATQELLDKINKNIDLKKTQEIVDFTKKLGIKTHLTFTFGLPGETMESARRTIDFALKLDPATVQFSIATPFPGTVFYKEMKERGHIVSENWAEYDGNYKSVITLDNIAKKDLERTMKEAYRKWKRHCDARNPFKKFGYYRLLLDSFRHHGIVVTFVKAVRLVRRRVITFLKEEAFYKKEIEKEVERNGFKTGRLTIGLEGGKLRLYWDGMKLTSGEGFASSFDFNGKTLQTLIPQQWKYEKINDAELLLARKKDALSLDEVWRIKVVDEKQIDWDVDIHLKDDSELIAGKIMLVLSGRYRTWVDSWGEGRFYSINNCNKIELRNPNSKFIGLRGREKLKGQLPTIFLDLARSNGDYSPAIKNADSVLGARVLEVQRQISNSTMKHLSKGHRLFSVRIKIVEEDFKKYKLDQKRLRKRHLVRFV